MATMINAPQGSAFESRKASAFLNFRLPSKSGKVVQIGSIPLYEDNRIQNGLLSAIKEGRQDSDTILDGLELNIVIVDETNNSSIEF